mgnify:CR=1 FL=1
MHVDLTRTAVLDVLAGVSLGTKRWLIFSEYACFAQVPKLQCLLDAILFEPGAHLPLASTGLEPMDVPSSAPELLGTAHHLLLNELIHSPSTVIESVLKLARQAVDLDTGTLKASTTTVVRASTLICRLGKHY